MNDWNLAAMYNIVCRLEERTELAKSENYSKFLTQLPRGLFLLGGVK